MEQGNYFNRVIYSYEFPDNHVYVGLTCRKTRRHKSHTEKDEKSPVFIYMKETGLLPELKYLTEYLPYYDAQKEEKYWVDNYKNKGWSVLNRAKCGGLGSNKIIWTKEKCRDEAMKYNTRTEFAKKSNSAYRSSLRNNWLDSICEHMGDKTIKRDYWNYVTCKNASKKCSTRFEFSRKYSRAHTISLKNGWLDEFYPEKAYVRKWNYDKCKKIASSCTSRSDFYHKYNGAYGASLRNKWIDDFYPNKI